MRRPVLTLISLAASALIFVSGAGAEQSYADPAGDAGPGPDLTAITVRNDATGLITIAVTTTAPLQANHTVLVGLDTDKNTTTGADGADFAAVAVPSSFVVVLYRITSATSFAPVATANTRYSASGNITELGLQRTDLGNTVGFQFFVLSGDTSGQFNDEAPAFGSFTYDLPACSNGVDDDRDGRADHPNDPGCASADDSDETNPLRLTAGKPKPIGAGPKAGKVVTVSMSVTQNDGKLFVGNVVCRASVGSKRLPARGLAARGSARCTMRIPAGTTGQTLRGAITAREGAASVTKPFVLRVR